MGDAEPKTREFSNILNLYEFMDCGGDVEQYDDGVYALQTDWEQSPGAAELTVFVFWNEDGDPLEHDSSCIPIGAPQGLIRVTGFSTLRMFFGMMRECGPTMGVEEMVSALNTYRVGRNPFAWPPPPILLKDVEAPTEYVAELRELLLLLDTSTSKPTARTPGETQKREELFLDMSSHYTSGASEEERVAMRALVKAVPMARFALGAVFRQITLVADGTPAAFERALGVVALWDGQSDYRDMLLMLAKLHTAAVARQLDVIPIYTRIAGLCSDTNPAWDVSARDILLSFAAGDISSELFPEETR